MAILILLLLLVCRCVYLLKGLEVYFLLLTACCVPKQSSKSLEGPVSHTQKTQQVCSEQHSTFETDMSCTFSPSLPRLAVFTASHVRLLCTDLSCYLWRVQFSERYWD